MTFAPKAMSKSLILFVASLLVFNSCAENTQTTEFKKTSDSSDNQKLQTVKKTSSGVDDKSKSISLQMMSISSERAVVELLNKTNNAIYLFYEPAKTIDANSWIFRYRLRCQERGKKEKDYNEFTSHVLPSLESLDKGSSFRFEVSPLPKIDATCKVSLLYYDDERIADLINNKPLDMNKSENKFVENGKKSAELNFELNNLNNGLSL